MSALAASVGLGLFLRVDLTPGRSPAQFERISHDGWIQNGSAIVLHDLATRGNKLLLEFNAWRPSGLPPAHLRVRLCGETASEFLVTPDHRTHTIYLSSGCEPRAVSFEVLNPFSPSEKDRRQLGTQLVSARLASKLGLPIARADWQLTAFLCILSLTVILRSCFSVLGAPRKLATSALIIAPIAAAAVLQSADYFQLNKILALWLVLCSLGIGIIFASGRSSKILNPPLAGISSVHYSLKGQQAVMLLAIVALGAVLRGYGLSFGLPHNFHPDEVPKVNAVMRMLASGTLNPEYFLHPSLLLYSTYFVNYILQAFAFFGEFSAEFRESAFIAGRLVSALAGTLSIYLTFYVGRRLFGVQTGLIAALFLAVFPLHVTCSRYLKEDALLTMMILACTAALLKAVQDDRRFSLFLSALFAGMAASTKYSGILSVLVVAASPWLRSKTLRPDPRWSKLTLLALLLVPAGFVLCTPYSILTPGKFLADLGYEQRHLMRGHTIPIDPWSQYWLYHFWRSIIPGISPLAAIASLIGAGILLWRRRVEDLFLVGMVLLFYLPAEWAPSKPEPQPERYIFPCLPFIAIAAGELAAVLSRSNHHLRTTSALVLAALIAYFPAKRTLQLASEIKDDTRVQLSRWMKGNLPPESKVYIDFKAYSPRFWHEEFKVSYLPAAKILEKLNVRDLRSSGYDYLVLSGLFYERYFTQPLAEPGLRQRLRDVFEQVPIVKQISPRYGTYGFHNPTLTLFSLKKEDFEQLDMERQKKKLGQLAKTGNEIRASLKWGVQ